MREIDAVLFDKTGTLTRGEHVVTDVAVAGDAGVSTRTSCSRSPARSSPTASTRSPARSCTRGRASAVPSPRLATSARSPAAASRRPSTATAVAVGGPALLRERGLDEPPTSSRAHDRRRGRRAARRCSTWCATARVIGALALEDEIRPESREAVGAAAPPRCPGRDDHRRRPPGRRRGRGRRSASTRCSPRCCPRTRTRAVAELQARGLRVAMVGRRGERRAGARPRRRRHRDRRRHRRRHRVGRCRAGRLRPAWRRGRDPPVARELPQDGAEPRLGRGLQRRRDPAGGRCAGLGRASRSRPRSAPSS